MANIELLFDGHILRAGKKALNDAIEYGIDTDDFKTAEGRSLFLQIRSFYHSKESAGAVYTAKALKQLFPTIELPSVADVESMSTLAWCHLLRQERLKKDVKQLALDMEKTVDVDPVDAINDAQSRLGLLQSLATAKNTDVTISAALDDIIQDIENHAAGIDTSIASWPWPSLQEASGGLQDDDYIVIYGRPKNKKSFLLAFMLAYWFMEGRRVLFYTKEMTPKNIFKRIAAFICGIPYQEMRSKELSDKDKRELYETRDAIRQLEHSDRFICLSGQDVPDGGDTVHWVQSKVEMYKPDIVAIDGIYLMSPSRKTIKADHERVRDISRGIRSMILRTKVPVFGTMQANREAAKHNNAELNEISFSDALGQDCTMAARVIASRTENKVTLVFGGSREYELDGLEINSDLCRDMSEIGRIGAAQIAAASDQDVDEGEAAGRKADQVNRSARLRPQTKKRGGTEQEQERREMENNIDDVM